MFYRGSLLSPIPPFISVFIFNRDIRLEEKKILPRIGSLIESPGFYPNLTGTENLRIFAKLRGIPRTDAIEQALKLVNLPYKDKKLYSQYSLGMKQRLNIAQAIFENQKIILLDEPTNALDEDAVQLIYKIIREEKSRGATIIVATHHKEDLKEVCDVILKIAEGNENK